MTLEELEAAFLATQATTPTLEELLFSTTLCCWGSTTPASSITGSTRMTLMSASMPVRVLSVSVSWDYQNLAASDTNYWTAALEHGTGPAGFPDLATRSTRNSGTDANGPIVARVPWTFDAAAWLSQDIAAGELLTVNWIPTGSVAALQMPMTYTVRYRPL